MDTPGIGDSRKLKTIVEEYVPKAVAFVIIMDVTRAGGMQKDRVISFSLFNKIFLNNENDIHAQKVVLCDKSYFMFLFQGKIQSLFLCLDLNHIKIVFSPTVEIKLRTLLQNLLFISLTAKSRITANARIDAMHRPVKIIKESI